MMLRLLVPILLVFTLAACGTPTASAGGLRVQASGNAVVLTNGTDATLYHFTVDRGALPMLTWAPCDDPATCTGIAPGAVERIPYDSLFTPSGRAPKEVVVHAWHLVPVPGGDYEVRMLPGTPLVLRL